MPLAASVVALVSTLRDVFQREAARLQLGRIDLHADRRLLLAADDHLRHAGDLRDLLREDVLGVVVDRR